MVLVNPTAENETEPTTDKFTVVIHGEEDRPVEGNSLAVIKELPYEGLTRFGTGCANGLYSQPIVPWQLPGAPRGQYG